MRIIEIGKFQIDGFEKEMSEYNFDRLRNFINENSKITFCWDNLQQKREFDIIDCLYAYLEYKRDYYRLFHGNWYLTDKGYTDKMREIINEKISDYLSDFSCISLHNSIRQIENMGLEARAFIVEYKKDSEESGITCSSQISE